MRRVGGCFYQRARRDLASADIIVANHALLFSDLVIKSEGTTGILPAYNVSLLMKRHNMERVAEDQFGIDISRWSMNYFLDRLYNQRKGKGLLVYANGAEECQSLVRACKTAARCFLPMPKAGCHSNPIRNHRFRRDLSPIR